MIVTSDIHLNPGELFPFDFRDRNHAILLNGDILNLIPWGMKAWRTPEGRRTIQSIVSMLPPVTGCIFIVGNHEGRISWVKELFKDYPQVKVYSSIDLAIKGEEYHFEHGHKLTDWWLWGKYADDVVMAFSRWDWSTKLWYKFCQKMNWMPKALHQSGMGGHPSTDKYEDIIGLYWANCLRKAAKKKYNLVVGHSHTPVVIDPNLGFKVIDTGATEEVVL